MSLQTLLSSLFLALAHSAAALPGKPHHIQNQPVVHISSGAVYGTINISFPNVEQYRSIPFAVPPLGDLRFAPPQKSGYLSIINATQEPPSCPQYIQTPDIFDILVPEINTVKNFEEDCLMLNVYKPTGNCKKLPVLIWLFGGGFSVGGIDTPYTDPKPLIERRQDLVVVKINYVSMTPNYHCRANIL
jgi:carboxylesterase type B